MGIKGMSLHIGLSKVLEPHYGWLPILHGAPNDAGYMVELAKKRKFITHTLTNEQASRENVIAIVNDIAASLNDGDLFLFTYSGHGGQFIQTKYTDTIEADGKDETWCLYNEQLIDDEIYKLFTGFKKGVRIVLVSDSCHSGTITRGGEGINKTIQQSLQNKILKNNLNLYQQRKKEAATTLPLGAAVLSLSACSDKQEALDLGFNGAFTTAIKICLQNEAALSYAQLIQKVNENMAANNFSQQPCIKLMNAAGMEKEIAFTI